MIDEHTDDVPRRRHLDNINNVVVHVVVTLRRHTMPMTSHQDLAVFDVLQSDPTFVLWTILDNSILCDIFGGSFINGGTHFLTPMLIPFVTLLRP